MALTLGEKLRQAREEKGISLAEVAEQTRISPIYLECIDRDDYRSLPGGIFNRGFIKSYAKYVGVNEQEAMLDYTRLLNDAEGEDAEEVKTYRPQVLTDDRAESSMVPTVIVSVIILGLMTAGVLFLLRYLRQPAAPAVENAKTANSANNANLLVETEANTVVTPSIVPDISTAKIEFKAISQPVSVTATVDGKTTIRVVTPDAPAIFTPKESLKLSYSRSLAQFVQLNINDTPIKLPAVPPNPKRATLEFEINKGNFGEIWTNRAITAETPSANPIATAPTIPHPPTPKPSIAANTAAKTPPPNARPPTPAVRPTANPAR